MADWHRVCDPSEIPLGTGKEITVQDRVLAVFRTDDAFHVLDGICPHAGGPLGAGTLTGSIVTCPWHGWQFDVTTGQHCLSQQICQPSFPVKVEADGLYVELP
ncbi:MAG: Rieske 2Fe-2S domain-containing protein [Planctomycetaceae bacterium]|nr:Rieske 2Fe-2S domain-containing protein [Planctomycetaceae bacterium]